MPPAGELHHDPSRVAARPGRRMRRCGRGHGVDGTAPTARPAGRHRLRRRCGLHRGCRAQLGTAVAVRGDRHRVRRRRCDGAQPCRHGHARGRPRGTDAVARFPGFARAPRTGAEPGHATGRRRVVDRAPDRRADTAVRARASCAAVDRRHGLGRGGIPPEWPAVPRRARRRRAGPPCVPVQQFAAHGMGEFARAGAGRHRREHRRPGQRPHRARCVGPATGVLQEAAMDLVRGVVPPLTVEEQGEDLLASMAEMQRHGITAFEDAAARPPVVEAYAALARAGRVVMRVRLCQYFDPAGDDDAQYRPRSLARRPASQTPSMRVASRSCSTAPTARIPWRCRSRTATSRTSSAPASCSSTRRDSNAWSSAARLPRVSRSTCTRWETGPCGRRSTRLRPRAQQNGPRDARHTLAHLALIDDADLRRFRELGVVANMSPRLESWRSVGDRIRAEDVRARAQRACIAHGRCSTPGAVVAWGSDWPVTGVNPLEGIETAVTRRYPGGKNSGRRARRRRWIPAERVTLPEAITAYTAAGAYLLHDEGRRGTIAAGKLADLVVLSRNLFAIDPLAIHAVAGRPDLRRRPGRCSSDARRRRCAAPRSRPAPRSRSSRTPRPAQPSPARRAGPAGLRG